jgi:hypothetical protein
VCRAADILTGLAMIALAFVIVWAEI